MEGRLRGKAAKAAAIALAFLMAALLTLPRGTAAVAGGPGAVAEAVTQAAVGAFLSSSGLGGQAGSVAGMLAEATSRGIPLLDRVTDPVASHVQERVREAVEEAAAVARAVRAVSGPAVRTLYEQLRQNPVIAATPDGTYQLQFPQGRLTLCKNGQLLGLWFLVAGTAGGTALLGISNLDPLCPVHAHRLPNPGNQPTAFLDLAPDGTSFIQARMPLGGEGLPALVARDFLQVGGQTMEISLGALDPGDTSVKGRLAVGLKATADAELSAEVELTGGIYLEVAPDRAARLMAGAAEAMAGAVGLSAPSRPGPLSPQQAAAVLRAGLQYLAHAAAGPDDPGEVGVEVETTCSLGAGILDTTAAVASASGSISLSLPIGDALRVGESAIRDFLQGGVQIAPVFQKLGSAVVLGQADARFLSSTREQLESAARGAARTAAGAFLSAASGSSLGLGFSVDLGGEQEPGNGGVSGGASGGGDKAEAKCTLFELSADLPLLAGVNRAMAAGALEHTMVALASLARTMLPAPPSGEPGQPGWEQLAAAVPEGTTFGIELSPGLPLVTVQAEMPARDLLRALAVQQEGCGTLLGGLVSAVEQGSLAGLLHPDRRAALLALFQDTRLEGLRKNSTFGICFGGGTGAEVGAELTISGGRGLSLYTEANPEMLLLLAGGSDHPDVTGRSALGFEVVSEASGGLSLGEGVEASVTAGLATSVDFLCVRFREWDAPLPPSEVTVAGFRVVDFEGAVRADGSISGSGRLLLPGGGLGSATFSLDPAGHVLQGQWSGSLVAAGREFTVASGTISDAGLHWTSTVTFPYSTAAGSPSLAAAVDFTLTANGGLTASGQVQVTLAGAARTFRLGFDGAGQLVATYDGQVAVGQRTLDTHLTFSPQGLAGTGTLHLPFGTVTLDLHGDPGGALRGTGSTEVTLLGQGATVTVALGPDGSLAGGATVVLNIAGQQRVFVLVLDADGNLAGSCSGTVSVGGRTLSNLTLTRSAAGTTLTGRTAFLGAQQTFSLALAGGQITSGTATASVPLLGRTATLNLTLSPTGEISGTGSVDLVLAGTTRTFNLVVDAQGNITGTCAASVQLGGRTIYDLALSRVNGQTALQGRINLAGTGVLFALSVDGSGNLTGSYTGAVNLAGRQVEATFRLGNDGTVTCTASVPVRVAGYDRQFRLTVDPAGNVTGTYDGSLTVGGRPISSVHLELTATGISGTGEITLAGAKRTFHLAVDTSGNVTGSYGGGVSLAGFQIGNEFVLASDGSLTCQGTLHLRVAGANLPFSVSVGPSGNVTAALSATHSGVLNMGGRTLTALSLTLDGTGMEGTARVNILGSEVTMQLSVDAATGALAGTAGGTLAVSLAEGKTVSLQNAQVSLTPTGAMSGSGTLKAGNASIAGAAFTVDAARNVSGTGTVKVRTLPVSCGFRLGPGTFSVWAAPPEGFSYRASKTVDIWPFSYTFTAGLSLGVKDTNKIKATADGTVTVRDKVTGQTVGSVGASSEVNLASGAAAVRVSIPPLVDKTVTFPMPWAPVSPGG